MATPIKVLQAFHDQQNACKEFDLDRECKDALGRVKTRINQMATKALSDLYYSRITSAIKFGENH